MNEAIAYFNQLSPEYLLLVASGLLLQGMVFTIFPEEAIILALGALWAQGRVEFWQALLAVQVGLLPANAALVLIGKKLGRRGMNRVPFRWLNRSGAVEKALGKLREKGWPLIAATRFTPLVRGPMYLAVGLADYRMRDFLKVDALASVVQISVLLAVGFWIGR